MYGMAPIMPVPLVCACGYTSFAPFMIMYGPNVYIKLTSGVPQRTARVNTMHASRRSVAVGPRNMSMAFLGDSSMQLTSLLDLYRKDDKQIQEWHELAARRSFVGSQWAPLEVN